MSLMQVEWPEEARKYIGASTTDELGRHVFKGPRIAMALHRTKRYKVRMPAEKHAPQLHVACCCRPNVHYLTAAH